MKPLSIKFFPNSNILEVISDYIKVVNYVLVSVISYLPVAQVTKFWLSFKLFWPGRVGVINFRPDLFPMYARISLKQGRQPFEPTTDQIELFSTLPGPSDILSSGLTRKTSNVELLVVHV